MKSFIISILAIISFSAKAELPEIRASKVTCEELQSFIHEHGTVKVLKKVFFKLKGIQVGPELHAVCGRNYYSYPISFRTLDESHCVVAQECVRHVTEAPRHREYDRYDYDYGRHYNPPSRGSSGPRYNPPSRSERGPRYCPSCR